MALPYHIYVVSSKIPQNEYTERVQYGAAFVFLVIVMGIALTSILLRIKMRNHYRWYNVSAMNDTPLQTLA